MIFRQRRDKNTIVGRFSHVFPTRIAKYAGTLAKTHVPNYGPYRWHAIATAAHVEERRSDL